MQNQRRHGIQCGTEEIAGFTQRLLGPYTLGHILQRAIQADHRTLNPFWFTNATQPDWSFARQCKQLIKTVTMPDGFQDESHHHAPVRRYQSLQQKRKWQVITHIQTEVPTDSLGQTQTG